MRGGKAKFFAGSAGNVIKAVGGGVDVWEVEKVTVGKGEKEERGRTERGGGRGGVHRVWVVLERRGRREKRRGNGRVAVEVVLLWVREFVRRFIAVRCRRGCVPDESAKKERGKSGEGLGAGYMRVRQEEAGTTGWEKGKEREEEARPGRVGREEEREGERPKR